MASAVVDSGGTEENKTNPCYHGAYNLKEADNNNIILFVLVST